MITITNVSKEFEKTDEKKKKTMFLADDNISFIVPDGQIVGLLGPNGAGKTTLLRIIAGIMKPTNGTVSFDGLTHEKNSVEIKRSIAFLSGNTKLYKDLSTVELLEICGSYYGIKKDEIKKRSEEVFKRLQMDSFKNQKIGKLSTGQTQRVGIARCILHDPHYYILDEVTSGLDIMASQVVLDFIREEKAKGKCIIYSTHYMEEAENLCDSVVLLNKGKVIRIGTAAEIEKETETTDMRSAFFKLIKEDVR